MNELMIVACVVALTAVASLTMLIRALDARDERRREERGRREL